LYHSHKPKTGTQGFTLIEALVALSIVAVALSSIGALIASTVRVTRAVQGRVDRAAAIRTLMTALPDRDQIVPGILSGDIDGHHWGLEVSAFANNDLAPQARAAWIPQTIVLTVQSPTAGTININTVRLRRRDEP
jgi:prepilin-type N-terminal cleavage/methylation domain-containing protein